MTAAIEQELGASGVANVIVVLAPPGAAAGLPDASEIEKYFTSSELSQESALAEDKVSAGAAAGSAPAAGADVAPGMRFYENLGVAFGTVDREGYTALQGDAGVAAVTGAPAISLIRPSEVAAAEVSASGLPDALTWGIKRIRADDLWAKGFDGSGVLVGHLDTGVDGNHPALAGAIQTFVEFDDFGREVPGAPATDSGRHGTHTAGTIAGRLVDEKSVGIAPGCQLASAMVIEGGQVTARVLAGMNWAVGQGVRILSMSLGFRGFHTDFEPVTQILRARNILPVFAVGNEGPGTSRSPGNYSEALSIGASQQGDTVPGFSSSQRFQRPVDPLVPDLIAPGKDVLSSVPGGGYLSMGGTSMATPHVAGLAALLFQAYPDADVDQVEGAIYSSCFREATVPENRANRGIPDGIEALKQLEEAYNQSPSKGDAKKQS